MEISSSIASQWIPIPPPIGSQPSRCRGVAASRRGNHANGAETVRPSSNTTISESSEHETSTANTSPLFTEVGIPFLQKQRSMFLDESSNHRKFVTSKATVRGQCHRFQPELCIPPGLRYVNMRRLAILQAVEEKPEAAEPQ
jgi:hypothetical protein